MKKLIILNFILLLFGKNNAQDLQQLSLKEAEEVFVSQNLNLLAEKYNIEISKAQTIQAKLIDNPIISLEQNIYNRINQKYFDFGKDGQAAVEIEQVINIAGQRNKRVRLEKFNEKISLYEFEELMRTLRSELRCSFTEMYFEQKNIFVFDTGINMLERFHEVMKLQEQKKNISYLELSRLETLLLSMQKERKDSKERIESLRGKLNTLLNIPTNSKYNLILDEDIIIDIDIEKINLQELRNIQKEIRPDLLVASTNISAANANLKLQKSLAAPEFSVRGIYDRAGNFINDYFAIGVSFSVPIFNRNQGNIKGARLQIEQNRTLHEQACKEAEVDLYNSYLQLENSIDLYNKYPKSLEGEFENLIEEIINNFRKRNISMTEFIDYYQSYKEAYLQINELKQDIFNDIEILNNTVGKTIINY